MNTYKALNNQIFTSGVYSLVPIRMGDRFKIMEWRNEQISHLRQDKPLTEKDQDVYFENVVAKLFDDSQPDQMLFSYLEGEKCIGYGGLVHINWKDKNAEISFIMDTYLEKDNFEKHWLIYLGLIERASFSDLGLHKIYTYAFDLRPNLYNVIERKGYENNARLKDHIFLDNNYIDILIHEKLSENYIFRYVNPYDDTITYKWASDQRVRGFSFNNEKISWDEHKNWFSKKLADEKCEFFILEHQGFNLGSIRFDSEENGEMIISYLIDPDFQGKGYGKRILKEGVEKLKKIKPGVKKVCGFVKKENIASIKIFERLGYNQIMDDGKILKFERNL